MVFPVIIIALLLATVIYIANNYQDNGVQSILQSCSALAAGYFGLEGLIKNKPEDLKLDSEKQFAETDLKMNEKTNIAGTSCFAEPDNVEKSVDSGLLTDKMGLGSDNYILTAFEQKQAGDYEGAILYYLFALDNDPAIEDVFWILLDICALYKELRQPDMAKEMLDNYSSKYEDIINEDIRDQIISNL